MHSHYGCNSPELRQSRRKGTNRDMQVHIWCLTGTTYMYACSQPGIRVRYGALRGVTPLAVRPGAVLEGAILRYALMH